ncbi:hypothetical protein TWF281_007573 [Arthrobotrys megalospora]
MGPATKTLRTRTPRDPYIYGGSDGLLDNIKTQGTSSKSASSSLDGFRGSDPEEGTTSTPGSTGSRNQSPPAENPQPASPKVEVKRKCRKKKKNTCGCSSPESCTHSSGATTAGKATDSKSAHTAGS